MVHKSRRTYSLFCVMALALSGFMPAINWESKFVKTKGSGLSYIGDSQGNIIPDFSRVGYQQGDVPLPTVPVTITISPTPDAHKLIQEAIDKLSAQPANKSGFRGTIFLSSGTYQIPSTIFIRESGIVLRGEGERTKLVATARKQHPLISVTGKGEIRADEKTRTAIKDEYVATGAFSFTLASAKTFRPGDRIIIYRPGTANWIKDIRMDAIEVREGTVQWQPAEYNLEFFRTITRVSGDRVYIDNPVVMGIDRKYGGGEIYRYSFEGRIRDVGIEDIHCESAYDNDTAEDHGWTAVHFNRIEHGWVRNVSSRYFGYSCVSLGALASFITVKNCRSYDPKSKITGSRRYSFNNDGQLNLFINCEATDGRHDFVTGPRVLGPNVFYNCRASRTHADIGPHHRWAVGTLYDNVSTDGEINIQDRGNWGTGHGWAGVTQVLWNCTAKRAAVQSPWASGKNYCIGLKGAKYQGRLADRHDGEWEGLNRSGLQPSSLYLAQLRARGKKLQ